MSDAVITLVLFALVQFVVNPNFATCPTVVNLMKNWVLRLQPGSLHRPTQQFISVSILYYKTDLNQNAKLMFLPKHWLSCTK